MRELIIGLLGFGGALGIVLCPVAACLCLLISAGIAPEVGVRLASLFALSIIAFASACMLIEWPD